MNFILLKAFLNTYYLCKFKALLAIRSDTEKKELSGDHFKQITKKSKNNYHKTGKTVKNSQKTQDKARYTFKLGSFE